MNLSCCTNPTVVSAVVRITISHVWYISWFFLLLLQTFETDADSSYYYSFEAEEDGQTVDADADANKLDDEAVTEKTEISTEGGTRCISYVIVLAIKLHCRIKIFVCLK